VLRGISSLLERTDAGDDPTVKYTCEVARINLLNDLEDFAASRAVLERLDELNYLGACPTIFQALKIPVVRNQEEIQRARISFNLCVRAKDFPRAVKFFNQVQERDPRYYSTGRSGLESGRDWEALLLAGLMQEGLGKKDEGLRLFHAAAYLAETHYENLQDPIERLTSFGQDDVASVFITAARICLEYDALRHPHAPKQFDCTPPLEGGTWVEQALLFLE
jgi:hypothetical protein